MKKIALLILFISFNSHADSYRFFCGGNRGRIAVYIYSKEEVSGKKMIFQYGNTLGNDNLPLFEGVVTKLTLPYIEMAKTELAPFNEQVVVSWPYEKCSFSEKEPLLVQCNGLGEVLYPKDSKLDSYTLTVGKVIEESLTNKFEMVKIRWGVDSTSLHYSLALPFDPKMCEASYTK